MVMPVTATFPELNNNEEYICYFSANARKYYFTLPFVDGSSCDASSTPILDFGSKQIRKLIC